MSVEERIRRLEARYRDQLALTCAEPTRHDFSEYVEGGPAWQSLGAAGQVVARATDPFLESDAWLKLRYEALLRNDGCCECCGNRASLRRPLHVDHIKPRSKYPELALELSNLQVLCKDCNFGKGARDETDWRAK